MVGMQAHLLERTSHACVLRKAGECVFGLRHAGRLEVSGR